MAINDRVRIICEANDIYFIDAWNEFYDEKCFDSKGIHFTQNGSNKLADVLIKQFNRIQGNF